MVAAKIGFLFLIAVALGLAVYFLKGRSGGSPGRRPGFRHWITRVICGVIGAAILVTILVATLRADRPSVEPVSPISLRVPTLPEPEAPKRKEDFKGGRFLVQMVVMQGGGFPGVPIASQSYDVRWPQDREGTYSLALQHGSRQILLKQHFTEIQLDRGNRPTLLGSMDFQVQAENSSRSRSGGITYPGMLPVEGHRHSRGLFALGKEVEEELFALYDITWIRNEDPLRPASLEEWVARRSKAAWDGERELGRFSPEFESDQDSPAAFLTQSLEVTFFPLLAAAILLAQLFRHRPLGFVKVAAGIILYVGALDRISLQRNQSTARDSSAPLEVRMIACSRLQNSAFFRLTAIEDLRALAADASVPKPLQARAARLIPTEK